MKVKYVLMWCIEELKCQKWSLEQVLEEINRDRSDQWSPYTIEDWREGWEEWCEGDFYKLLNIRYTKEEV